MLLPYLLILWLAVSRQCWNDKLIAQIHLHHLGNSHCWELRMFLVWSLSQNAASGGYLPREYEVAAVFAGWSCASDSFIFAHQPEPSLTMYKGTAGGPCYSPGPALCNSFLPLLELQSLRSCIYQCSLVVILQQTSHTLQKLEIYMELATAREQAGNHSQWNWDKPWSEKLIQRQSKREFCSEFAATECRFCHKAQNKVW